MNPLGFALLIVASPAAATSAAYPVVAILDAARAACDDMTSERLVAGFAKRGWAPYAPNERDWFGRYVAQNSEGGAALKVVPHTYRKRIAGREVYALAVQMDFTFAPGKPVLSCEVFDPDAPAIDGAAIKSWARRAPRTSSDQRAGWFFARWEPGLGRGVVETSITSTAHDTSPYATAFRPGVAYSSVSSANGRR